MRRVDNAGVRAEQLAKLRRLRAERDSRAVDAALDALTAAAALIAEGSPRTDEQNLLALSVHAARAQATVGEISDALEKVFGRHAGQIRIISGVYSEEAGASPAIDRARELVDAFAEAEGRQPRILVAKMGQDGHDRGQKVIATAFADLGFDVDVGPLFQTPAEVARQAVEADVHVVGVNSLAAGHLTLVPELRAELAELDRPDIMIVVGGVIPPADYPALHEAGAAAVFGPGTVIAEAAVDLLEKLAAALRRRLMARPVDVAALAKGVLDGSRSVLARAITLVESQRADHRAAAQQLLMELLPHAGRSGPGGDQRAARGREVDVHRGAGHAAHRRRAPGRGARGRPVLDPHPRLDPGRQDPDGPARGRRERVRPALAERRHAGRGGPGDPGDDRADGGGRVRRRAGGDGRGRAVRGGRGRRWWTRSCC